MAKKKQQEGEAENSSVSDIETRLAKQFGDGVIKGASYILDKKDVIIPVSPMLDSILGGGIKFGSFVIPTGPPKVGKLQDLDSLVYTPSGAVRIGDLSLGDEICSPNGSVCRIEQIFEFDNKDIYEVEFSDGSKCRCGPEHLWYVKSRDRKNYEVLSLESILKLGLYIENGTRPKWEIPLTEPVSFITNKHFIHPYVLGAIIGDGCLVGGGIKFTSNDDELVTKINSLLDDGFYFKRINSKSSNISFQLITSQQINKYKIELSRLGLYGKNGHYKFIPKEYLIDSVENRWSLLQGLMDTDGSVQKTKNSAEYTSVSHQLICDIKELVQSLGGMVRIQERYTSYDKKKFFKSYRCHIKFTNKDKLFSLSRKHNRIYDRKKNKLKRRILKVTYIGKKPARCIKVSSKEGLYLTNEFIVTHNTSMSLDFCTTGLEIPYDLGPRKLYIFNIEGRLNRRDLLGIKKLAPYVENNRVVIIGSERGRILSGENYLDIGEQLINEKPGCMFLFDSFSQLCSKAGKEKEWDGTQFRDDVPKLLSQFCKRISNVIPINESIVIGITHQIANTGFGFSPWAEASGNKVQYAVDVKLKATHCKEWKSGDTVIGQDVFWECYCSPLLNGPSETKCTSKLRYGYGIDKEAELVDLCVDLGLIKKGGAWYELQGGEKFQGLEKVRDALVANPEIYKELNKNIRGMLDLPECM